MGMRVVHTADLHLGRHFHFAKHSQSVERARDLKAAFTRIVDVALQERAEAFLIAGDVFDRLNPTNEYRVFFIQELRRLRDAGVHVFAIAGNHDFPKTHARGHTAIDEAGEAGLCHVFNDPEKLTAKSIDINGEKLTVWAKPFDPVKEHECPLNPKDFKPVDGYNVIMLHGAFVRGEQKDIDSLPPQMQQHPVFESSIPEGVDYVALGHIHNPTVPPLKLENGAVIGNPGSIETLDRAERKYKNGCIILEFSSELSARYHKIETRATAECTFTVTEEVEDVTEAIIEKLHELQNPGMILWLDIGGTISDAQYRTLDMRRILQEASERFFAYSIDRSGLNHEEFGRLYSSLESKPVDTFRKVVEEEMKGASKERKKLYRDVLRRGTQLLQGDGGDPDDS